MADELDSVIKLVVVASVIPMITQRLNPSPFSQIYDLMMKSVAMMMSIAPLQYFMNTQKIEAKLNYLIYLITGSQTA